MRNSYLACELSLLAYDSIWTLYMSTQTLYISTYGLISAIVWYSNSTCSDNNRTCWKFFFTGTYTLPDVSFLLYFLQYYTFCNFPWGAEYFWITDACNRVIGVSTQEKLGQIGIIIAILLYTKEGTFCMTCVIQRLACSISVCRNTLLNLLGVADKKFLITDN